MVKGILFFLWLASSWATLAADRAVAQTLPDGCPDIQGTYYYPIAPNTNPDGSDNAAGRAQNRRVEVVIEN